MGVLVYVHRDRYLEQQLTKKIETEVRDIDRTNIESVRMLSRVAFWEVIL
jgi:hypothetical protein